VGGADRAAIQGETKTMKESDISTTPKRDESVNPEAKAAAAPPGAPNFIAKHDGSGNPTANSIMYDDGTNVGIGTTSPAHRMHVLAPGGSYGVVGTTDDHHKAGVRGENSDGGHGVEGQSLGSLSAIYGFNIGSNSQSELNFRAGSGVFGESLEGIGVLGVGYAAGVWGSTSTGAAVHGKALNTSAFAGKFEGKVTVLGTLSKSSGAFKIDHPLDPQNKYLYHSFIESPDMMNIYNGNVTTDEHGEAKVTLPDYFEALNRDFRYQLTVVGQFAQAIVASKIKGNGFTIKTDKPSVEVSWQVTGVRQDAYANAHRIQVEEEKPASERGRLLHPEVYGQAPQGVEDEDVPPEVKELMKKHRERLQKGCVAKFQ
jgi:hypothetical protein